MDSASESSDLSDGSAALQDKDQSLKRCERKLGALREKYKQQKRKAQYMQTEKEIYQKDCELHTIKISELEAQILEQKNDFED